MSTFGGLKDAPLHHDHLTPNAHKHRQARAVAQMHLSALGRGHRQVLHRDCSTQQYSWPYLQVWQQLTLVYRQRKQASAPSPSFYVSLPPKVCLPQTLYALPTLHALPACNSGSPLNLWVSCVSTVLFMPLLAPCHCHIRVALCTPANTTTANISGHFPDCSDLPPATLLSSVHSRVGATHVCAPLSSLSWRGSAH
eukprot:353350-Chlamydomonas_euryale.AAC.14